MTVKYAQGIFLPKNPHKYIGKGSIKYRSSWEMAFMHFLDNHPGVLQWASESIRIPYRHPLTGKITNYVPDFFIYIQDKTGRQKAEVIEIKPSKEITMEAAKTMRDKAMVVINMAKWKAAKAWCQSHGMTFRIVSEKELFHQGGGGRLK